jgi:hypothetical protein
MTDWESSRCSKSLIASSASARLGEMRLKTMKARRPALKALAVFTSSFTRLRVQTSNCEAWMGMKARSTTTERRPEFHRVPAAGIDEDVLVAAGQIHHLRPQPVAELLGAGDPGLHPPPRRESGPRSSHGLDVGVLLMQAPLRHERHELAVLDVKTALSCAIKNISHYELVEFSTWPLLYQFQAAQPPLPGTYHPARVLIKPDGFVRLHEQATDGDRFENFFFLEVDRSTEPRETLARRVYGYQDFYRRGGLALRHGFTREEYKDFPFRVLMVLPNEERRNNMAERLLQNDPPALTMVWLTTFAEVIADPLGAIWMRPLDYRDITKGTQYDPSRPRTGAYRRDPAREGFIIAGLRKLRLLE